MSIFTDSNLKKKTFLLVVIEIILAWFIHIFYSKPQTSIIGAPLLYPNGGKNLQIQIFLGINFLVIPIFYAKNFKQIISKIENIKNTKKSGIDFTTPAFMSLISFIYLVFTITTSVDQLFNRPGIQLLVACIILGCVIFFRNLKKILVTLLKVLSKNKNSANFSLVIIFFSLAVKYYDTGTRLSLFFAVSAPIVFLLLKFLQNFPPIKENQKNLYELVFIGLCTLILYSRKNGALNLHAFEDFRYVNAKLMREGYLPWKDFSLEHGIWEDGLRQIIGGLISQNTFWGQATGVAAVVHPLEVFVLLACIYAISQKFLFTLMVMSSTFILNYIFQISFISFPRIIPAVIITVLIKDYNEEKKLNKLILIGMASGLGILWTPEYIYFLFGILLTLGLNRSINATQKLKSGIVFVSSLVLTICLILGPTGLLRSWAKSFLSDSSGYLLAWGAPFQFKLGIIYVLFFFLIPIFCISIFTFFVHSYSTNRIKKNFFWLLPLVVTLAAYYLKFLQWPDSHIGQPISIFLIVAIVLLGSTNKKWMASQKLASTGFAFALAVVLVAQTNENIYSIINTPKIPEVGFVDSPTFAYASRIDEVNKDFSNFIGKGKTGYLFDFGNEPVTWYGLLDFKPIGSTTKVLNLYSSNSQKNVLRNLEKSAPKYVIWGGEYGYWSWPFSGNWMKQYLISEYILDNYQPIKQNGGYLLMLRNNYMPGTPKDSDLKFLKSVDCNWYLGAERFQPPKDFRNFREIKITSSKIVQDQKILTFESATTKFGLGAQSDRNTSVTIQQGNQSSGKITFNLTRSDAPKQIWLAGCPAWKIQNSNTIWSISVPSSVDLKIFEPTN